jgi:hypothetical protein
MRREAPGDLGQQEAEREKASNRPDQVIAILKIVAASRGAIASWEYTAQAKSPQI